MNLLTKCNNNVYLIKTWQELIIAVIKAVVIVDLMHTRQKCKCLLFNYDFL